MSNTDTSMLSLFSKPTQKAFIKHAGGDAGIAENLLVNAATLTKRAGTGKHLGLAMYLAPTGATQVEVNGLTGDTQVNAYSDAINSKVAVAVSIEPRGANINGRPRKVYALTLKPKAAAKPKPAKPTAAQLATLDAQVKASIEARKAPTVATDTPAIGPVAIEPQS